MSTSIINESRLSGGSSISHHLRAVKKELEDLGLGRSIATTPGQDEVDALERDALEVLRLIRSQRNRLVTINQIPPEVLTLIPDFWDKNIRKRGVIALTHVCRVWREIFTSRSSLWTYFYCMDAEKTRVYLERSKSSPINLWLDRDDGLLPHDPFFQIGPHSIGRLKYLLVSTMSDCLQEIADHLSHPAPLLEDLTIIGSSGDPEINPVLATTLFGGDLSSLRVLHLQSIRTRLPWRNMVNLTSFSLHYVLRPRVSVKQLLDFFESAPHLLDIDLSFAAPAFGAQDGRLVSLGRLKKLNFYGYQPPSLLLDHLLIPAGAKVTTDLDLPGPNIEEHLPRSLDNLRNISNFTKISLRFGCGVSMRFTGPNGEVCMTSSPGSGATRSVIRSLAQFDISTTKSLEILGGGALSKDLCQALPYLNNLRTLTLSLCKSLPSFILALYPGLDPVNPIVCPKLEGLVFRTKQRFDIESMVMVAAARASGGAPLKSVRIINCGVLVSSEGVRELLKYVLCVETSLEVSDEDLNYGEGSDGEE